MINSTHIYVCTYIIYIYMKSYLATARWRVTENAAFFRQRLNRELRGDQELKLSSVFTGINAFTSFARIISFWLAIVDLFGMMSLSLHRYCDYWSFAWICQDHIVLVFTSFIDIDSFNFDSPQIPFLPSQIMYSIFFCTTSTNKNDLFREEESCHYTYVTR